MPPQSTDQAAISKQVYLDKIQDAIFKNNFLVSQLKTMPVSLEGAKLPIRTAPPPGVSATLSRAISNANARGGQYRAFLVTPKTLHGVARITGDQYYGTNTQAKAYSSLGMEEQRGLVMHMAKMLEVLLFRDGWGDIGVVQSFTGSTITLTRAGDANNVEAGMTIVAAAAKATGDIRAASTNGAFIQGVNPSEGILTFEAAVDDATNGVSADLAIGDTLFVRGNREEDASPSKLVLTGLAGWLPGSNPGDESSTPFFGVDRNGNSRLYGMYLDGTSLTWMEILITADQLVHTNGGEMDMLIVSPNNFKEIQVELQGKIQYATVNLKPQGEAAKVNFKAIEINGMSGQTVTVVTSRGCSDTQAFGLSMKTWSLKCMHGKGDSNIPPVDIFTPDGNIWLRTTDDQIEVRAHSRSELACNAPGYNIRIDL